MLPSFAWMTGLHPASLFFSVEMGYWELCFYPEWPFNSTFLISVSSKDLFPHSKDYRGEATSALF
jgi:hypothetical protein